MSGFRSILPLILLPVLAGAQEPSGLEKAKQDLKTLPSIRKESDRPALNLPNIAAPSPAADLSAPMPSPSRSRANADEAKSGKGTDNWLVDAMMKEDSRQAGTGRKGAKMRDEAHPLDADSETDGTDRNSGREPTAAKNAELDERARASDLEFAKVESPLTPFMADWISKRDHALLLPKGTSEVGFVPETPGLVGGPDRAVAITFRGIDGRLDPVAAPEVRQPGENPFLQALQAPPVTPPPAAPAPTLPGVGDLAPALMPPEPARDPRSPPPIDFSKPSQDNKYFPQLKRF